MTKNINESPFWHLLATRMSQNAQLHLEPIFVSLNERSAQLELPISYNMGKSLLWAIICQLFILSKIKASSLGKLGFSQMMLGFGHAFTTNDFPRMAFERIMGNISSPSFSGRTFDESVADTFLANGLTLINEAEIEPAFDSIILSECLSDSTILSLGKRAVTPPSGIWEQTVEDYAKRRPGLFKRIFSNTNTWLLDK